MMQVLIESGTRTVERRGRWTAASMAVHGAIIGAAVMATMRASAPPPARVGVERVVYVAPQTPTNAVPVAQTVARSIARPSFTIPSIAVPSVQIPSRTLQIPQLLRELGAASSGAPSGTPTGGIHTSATVDRIVSALSGNGSPSYPTRLSNAGVEGDVLARFVVDTLGAVEPASIHIVEASHALFGESVRQWLRRNRYSPAQVQGRPVRQLVQQRIGFTLRR